MIYLIGFVQACGGDHPDDGLNVPESKKGFNTYIDSNLIVKRNWGVSFTKYSDCIVTVNTSKELIITHKKSCIDFNCVKYDDCGSTDNEIYIKYILGDTIFDFSVNFGGVAYYYDKNKNVWMEIDEMHLDNNIVDDIIVCDPTTGLTRKADVTNITKDGLIIFDGRKRRASFIIPLSYSKFLRLNIQGGDGGSLPLDDLLETIRKI